MKCPTFEDVYLNEHNQRQLAIWWRFATVVTPQDADTMKLIGILFEGFTPELSKEIGWDKSKYA